MEKTDFPFSSKYQLQIASWLGVGLYGLLLFTSELLSGTHVVGIPSMPLGIYMCISLVVSQR